MRRLSIALFLVLILILSAGIAACGTSEQSVAQSPTDQSPEALLAAAFAASQDMASAQGTFEVAISFEVDESQLPAEAKAFVGQPMTVSGTLAYGSEPQTVDLTVAASLAGETMNMGMRLLDTAGWVQLAGQWYEAPPEMLEMLGDSAGQEAEMAEMLQKLAELGIDPTTWMKELRLVGEETLDGSACYHLAASPDLIGIMTDVIRLMESSDETAVASSMMPSAEEIQQMQTQLTSLFSGLTADLWIAKEDMLPRKAMMGARITPPAGEDAQGLKAIVFGATIALEDVNEPVTVGAPAAAQPWSALEKLMQENPGILMGPFSGLLGGAAAMPETVQ